MNVFKRNVLAAALMAAALVSTAVLAQEVTVDGKDFLSGAGDAKLADIAKQAAAAGKHLVVTAPNYWQSKAAAKLHAGAANVDVQMKEGFFENVLVRVEDGKAKATEQAAESKAAAAKVETQKAEAAKAEAARLEAARAQAEREEAARQETAKTEAAKAEAARQEAARQEAARAEAAKAEAAKQQAAKAAADAKAKSEKEAADKLAAQKKAMLQNLNGGREAEGTISANQLQKDDQVFVNGQFRGAVRRGGARSQFFWLDGDLNLDRVELLPLGDNHYKVNDAIRDSAPLVLRTKSTTGHIAATVPAPDSADRKSLQQQFAEGKNVVETLAPTDLRSGDIVYIGKSAALVSRLQGTTYLRFWLDGDLNFGQAGLQKQGANAYRVISDTIH
jgi:chemotaxis protein histidine kinase CheA